MRPFHLVTRWDLPAPVRHVWGVLMDPVAFASRWPRVEAVSWRDATPLRKGGQIDWVVRNLLRTTLRFTTQVTELDAFRRIALTVDGDLQGAGECKVEQAAPRGEGPSTRLVLDWTVTPDTAAMRVIAAVPGGRRLLTWGHHRIMEGARQELVRRLTATV